MALSTLAEVVNLVVGVVTVRLGAGMQLRSDGRYLQSSGAQPDGDYTYDQVHDFGER